METTCSSQVWNIKEEGTHVLAAEEQTTTSSHLKFCSWKWRILPFPLSHDEKGLVSWESSWNAVIRDITLCNIIAEGFRFIYLAFRFVHGLFRCTDWAQVFTRARGGCDNQKCHNKNPRQEMSSGTWMDVMPGSGAEDFGNLKKKPVSWDLSLEEACRFSELAKDRPVVCGGGAARGGVRGKSQHRKKLCLSLLMSKNLKLKKVIKSFVPEPISSVFRIPIWLWTYVPFTCLYLGRIFGRGYVTSVSSSSSSSSSCRTASTEIPDPLSPLLYHSSSQSSPLAGLQGYIPYPHIAAVCMFELVILLLLGPMRGSIGVHHLWAHLCFSCSILHVWFV